MKVHVRVCACVCTAPLSPRYTMYSPGWNTLGTSACVWCVCVCVVVVWREIGREGRKGYIILIEREEREQRERVRER